MTQTHTVDVWSAIGAHRLAVADLVDDLSDDEWRHPSLCDGWTVRDVAAHLTLQELTARDMMGVMLRWRGTMNRTIANEARRRAAAMPTAQLAAEIRGTVGSRRPQFGVTATETLTDILVHSQDIAIPLGRTVPVPAEAAAVSAARCLSMRWPPPVPASRIARRFRLIATDMSWTGGDGPEVRGPMAALLLAITGRRAGLARLTGPGVAELGRRLAA
jgi:uncharacterized protein (TIGR03083 family)